MKKKNIMAFVQTPVEPKVADVVATTVLITPALAAEWLTKNKNNRHVRNGHVLALARLMQAGLYVPALAEPIAFDRKDNLTNGQHRLLGIVKSGVSFLHPVVHGVDFDVFNRPMPSAIRTKRDAITAAGIKNAGDISSMLVYVHNVHMGTTRDFYSQTARIVCDDIKKIYDFYPDLHDSIEEVRASRIETFASVKHVVYAAHYLFSRVDREKADTFIRDVLNGEGLVAGDPALATRDRMQREMQSKAKDGRAHRRGIGGKILAYLVLGWNAYAAGRRLPRLTVPSEFPAVYGFGG